MIADLVAEARAELYRGAVQLQLLARGLRRHLPAASAQCRLSAPDRGRQHLGRGGRPCATPGSRPCAGDFNFDARQEVFLNNDSLARCCRLIAAANCTSSMSGRSATTCWRRSPAGPRHTIARCWPASTARHRACPSIHDRIVFKQPGLDQRVQYDSYLRKSLLDHFYDNEVTLSSVVAGQAMRARRLSGRAVRSPRAPQS